MFIASSLIEGNIFLENLIFDGQNTVGTLLNRIIPGGNKTANLYVNNCTFLNAGYNTSNSLGAYIQDFDTVVFNLCNFDNITYFGVNITNCNKSIVKYCTINNCKVYGITTNECNYCVYDHNIITNCGSGGFDAEVIDYKNKNTDIFWTNNIVEDCGNDDCNWGGAIVAGNGCNGIISNNIIRNYNMLNKKNIYMPSY